MPGVRRVRSADHRRGAVDGKVDPRGGSYENGGNEAGQLIGLVNRNSGGTAISTYGTMAYAGTGDLETVTSTIPGMTSFAPLGHRR